MAESHFFQLLSTTGTHPKHHFHHLWHIQLSVPISAYQCLSVGFRYTLFNTFTVIEAAASEVMLEAEDTNKVISAI